MKPAGAVLIVLSFVAGLFNLARALKLQDNRIDVHPGEGLGAGRSPVWQLNMLTPANYRASCRSSVRWLQAGLAFQFVLMLAGIIALAAA